MVWLISNVNTPGADAQRDELRAQHRAYLSAHSDMLILSGPLQSDDGASSWGSVFLIDVATVAEAQAFSQAEPFTWAGLYEKVTIVRVHKGLWNPGAMP